MPDSLIIVPEFPPSKGVIQALLDLGYYFSSSAALDLQVILRSFLESKVGNTKDADSGKL